MELLFEDNVVVHYSCEMSRIEIVQLKEGSLLAKHFSDKEETDGSIPSLPTT